MNKKMKIKMRMLSLLLCCVMLIGLLPTTAFARSREIIPADSGNSLNMSVSASGVLTWDDVPGATGYRVVLTQPNITELYRWDVTNSFLNLTTEMDGYKCDSGQYTLVVTAKGVSGVDATMSYYYTSHVDKLESPNNLVWIGDKAAWDAVDGATSYNVSLYNFSGEVLTIPTTGTLYDFSGSSPEDGWTFRVQALSNGTWSAKRYSDYTESPAKGSRIRTITPVNSGNSLNMSVSASGVLTWNDVPGATGYRVVLTKPNITELYHWDVTNSFLNLTTEMDGYKCDSGQYTLVVTAKGVSGFDATMSYYYTSHVDKLESPNNLVWIGDKAAWDAVDGATSYNVSLYNFFGEVVTIPTTGTLYDFSGSSPEDGWTFRVQALSNGTWSAKRYSDYTESPAKDASISSTIYNIGAYVYDDTLDVADSGGRVSLTTDKGTDGWSDSGYIKEATEGTTVTLNAEPAEGYVFVEWRQGTGGATISTDANYQFNATEHKYLYAIFEQVTTPQTTYSINCVSYNLSGSETAGTVYVETDKGSYDGSTAFGTATENTNVTINAVASSGYEFVEWRKGAPADPTATFSTNANHTFNATETVWLYAIFQEIPTHTYTVTFNANGGVGTMADVSGISGEYTLPANEFTAPDGKQFKAWMVDGVDKAVGDKITVTADTTVTAVWEDIPEGHICDIKPVSKIEPTCTEDGKEAYYKCESCGKFYEDALGTSQITDLSAWGNLEAFGHTESDDWKYDDDNHWKECTVEGCGAIIDDSKAAHKDDNKDGKCDICEYNSNVILGDVDGDGFVTMSDVVMLQKAIAKLITFSEDQIIVADVNFDGKNTMEDVVTIQKYIAKLITSFDTIKNN